MWPAQDGSGRGAKRGHVKYASKQDLIGDIELQHAKLRGVLEGIPPEDYSIAGVWGDDWTVKDLVAHLTAWLSLSLDGTRLELPG